MFDPDAFSEDFEIDDESEIEPKQVKRILRRWNPGRRLSP